jgi:hypothetical protein
MRVIRLMPDYQCFPLWEASPGTVGNIDPASLPLSVPVQERLTAWAGKFDATLNMNDPASSGFATQQVADAFRREGEVLARLLQNELGADYVIVKQR